MNGIDRMYAPCEGHLHFFPSRTSCGSRLSSGARGGQDERDRQGAKRRCEGRSGSSSYLVHPVYPVFPPARAVDRMNGIDRVRNAVVKGDLDLLPISFIP
ncbi:MAG: hypothetical protein ACYC1V_28665, partial [Pirellulaceae bacterium]